VGRVIALVAIVLMALLAGPGICQTMRETRPPRRTEGSKTVTSNDPRVTLEDGPDVEMHEGGTVTHRVLLDGRWVGWVGDGRPWRGSTWGGRRWWACWREDGDTGARWSPGLDYLTRTAALAALIEQVTAPPAPPLVTCSCGMAAADDLACGDPCCSRCNHPGRA
jgi:hypothetical protein